MNHLSVMSIVKNEIDHIARMVETTLPFITSDDEMIIVDGGSDDGTWEYLQTLKDLKNVWIYQQKQNHKRYGWKDHDQISNFIMKMCTNEWILSIDADESYDRKLFEEMPKLINQTDYNVYYLPTYHFYHSPNEYINDGDFYYPDLHIRLAKRDAVKWVGGDHKSLWKTFNDGLAIPFSPTSPDAGILPYHLFHYARIEKTHRTRLGREPVNPPLVKFDGVHPRDEYNESSSDKST